MFSNMLVAEKKLLENCQKGKLSKISEERPDKKTKDNEIRTEFLRALILSNNQEIDENGKKYILKIDPQGVMFNGAYISGTFDFSFCNTDLPFLFIDSVFENKIDISDSKIRFLNLHNCKVVGINAQGLFCQSNVFLRNGFESNGKVDFNSAQIEGNLDCSKGKFINEKGDALNCNGAKIKGAVFLDDGFEAKGEVSFILSQIGFNLQCSKGKFINEKGDALSCDKAKIGGSVFLQDDFEVKGEVNFGSCSIDKSLIFSKSNAISFLSLNSAQISRLSLDFEELKEIDLDGCSYEHLDSFIFSKLLEKMPKEDDFKPQPYKQLAKVLRNMGHHKEADDVMIEYNNKIFNMDFKNFKERFVNMVSITFRENWNFFKNLIKAFFEVLGFGARRLYKTTAGYGYRLIRVFITMFIIWLSCGLFYWNASKVAVFAPNNPLIFQKKDCYECHVEEKGTSWSDIFNWQKYNSSNNWIDSKLEGEYTTFNPFLYSLDVILPIVDLQVEKDWGQYVPSNDWTLNDFTRWLMWFEILFGWIYSLILVAILSGLAKNEKD